MFSSKLSLHVVMARGENRNIIPHKYENGVLFARIPTRTAKVYELYTAIAYAGKTVFSNTVLDAKTKVDVDIPVGTVNDVWFYKIADEKNLVLKIDLLPHLVNVFDKLACDDE